MAKSLHEAPITTPNARRSLPLGVHWRRIDAETHLGYRKGKRSGVWLVRWRVGAGYKQAALGTADDAMKVGTLNFQQAEAKAKEAVKAAKVEAQALADGPPLTVRLAVERYVEKRNKRESERAGRAVRSTAAQCMDRYLLGTRARGKRPALPPAPLADVLLHRLTITDLQEWCATLPPTLKRTSVRRIVNDLKAALNETAENEMARLPAALPVVIKTGLQLGFHDDGDGEDLARDNQILTDTQVANLIRAARQVDMEKDMGGDLFRLVVVLAATGARFSQVARMRVRDCQIAARRLLVPRSRKGKTSKTKGKPPFIPVPIGRDVVEAMVPAVTGRSPDEPLLLRPHYRHIPGSIRWERTERGPWVSARDLTFLWPLIRDKACLPGVIPYALRHSSIVRGIRANLPLRLVADGHDTSTEMIETHYARDISTGLEDMARAAIVPLVPNEGGADIVRLRGT